MSPSRIHSRRHPTRTQSTNLISSLTLALFLLISVILLCPVATKANEQTRPEYGTVIGIGAFYSFILLFLSFIGWPFS